MPEASDQTTVARERLAGEIQTWLSERGAVVARGVGATGIPVLLIELPDRTRHHLRIIDAQGREHDRLNNAGAGEEDAGEG